MATEFCSEKACFPLGRLSCCEPSAGRRESAMLMQKARTSDIACFVSFRRLARGTSGISHMIDEASRKEKLLKEDDIGCVGTL